MWAWRSITPRMIARRMFRSIVVGTDGSDTARQAVREATALAAALGASIELVCAFEPVAGQRLRDEPREAPREVQWMINAREDVEATLREAAAEVEAAGVPVTTYAREGDPADAILDVAEERGADLVVVGNKGMTGAKRFLLGSVPNKVSHHAPCSVLIIRTTPAERARGDGAGGVEQPGAVAEVRPAGAEVARRGLQARLHGRRARVGADHAGGDHERGRGAHVRRGHRGAHVAAGQPEAARRAVEGHLEDVAAGLLLGAAVRFAGDAGVLAAAGGDDVEVGAVVGVLSDAAVLGRGADRQHLRGAGGVGDAAGGGVAGGADHERALAAGVAQRGEDVGDLGAGHLGAELEREVDHVGAVAGGEADAGRDRDAVALPEPVEHAHRHDPRAVGQAGHAHVVVGALADRARDVRPVAVLVVGPGVAVDEVVARHEVARAEVRRAAAGHRAPRVGLGGARAAPAVAVGDARVEHRDRHARAARAPDVDHPLPGVRRVDAVLGQEVPLDLLPAPGAPACRGRREERARASDRVRGRGGDLGPGAQLAQRLGDRLPSRIVSTRVRGANTRGPLTPVSRCTAARAARSAERS